MRLIVAGSRDFNNYAVMSMWLHKIEQKHPNLIIISGTARGADKLGERWANDNDVPVERYPADWENYGKSAGYIRNSEMADVADAVIVFWDGNSNGTRNMIKIAQQKGLPIKVVQY